MKEISNKFVYVVLGIVLLVAFKNPETSKKQEKDRFITITGSADMLVPPDKIAVDVTYQEYWRDGWNKNKMSINEIEKQIVKAAKEVGVLQAEITINASNVWQYHWNYWHYWYNYYDHLQNRNLTIKVNSSSQLNLLISELKKRMDKKRGIINIELKGSSNNKIQEYRKMVKKRAVQAAQEKADYLLEAVGEKRGDVVSIEELNVNLSTTTTRQGYHGWGWPYYGGYNQTVTSSPNVGISNSSVAMPSNSYGTGGENEENETGLKPIKLRYEIKTVFKIEG